MTTLRHVLLDIDGTLLDSNDAHARAWVGALREHGVDVEFDRVRGMIGMGGDLLLPAIAEIELDSPRGRKIAKTRTTMFLAELPWLKPFPRAADLVRRLREAGLGCVVATSAGAQELRPMLEQCGIAGLVDHVTSAADAAVSKPAPDIVEAALAKAQATPDEAVMIGDTPFDIEAARRAGVRIVAVRSGGWPFTERDGALAVYDDVAAILAAFDGSVFGQSAGPPS